MKHLDIEVALKAFADTYFASLPYTIDVHTGSGGDERDPALSAVVFRARVEEDVAPLYYAYIDVTVETPAFSDQVSFASHRTACGKAGEDGLFAQANKGTLGTALQAEGWTLTGGKGYSIIREESQNTTDKWVGVMEVKMGVEKN